jgi:hypothetical protein
LLILDECQALKSITAKRTRAIYAAKIGLIHTVRRVWALSGTPAPNHPGEWWTHYRCLFAGKLDNKSFVDRFCLVRETKFGAQIVGANRARTPELATPAKLESVTASGERFFSLAFCSAVDGASIRV